MKIWTRIDIIEKKKFGVIDCFWAIRIQQQSFISTCPCHVCFGFEIIRTISSLAFQLLHRNLLSLERERERALLLWRSRSACPIVNSLLTLWWRRSPHIETSPLICWANQWIGFYMMATSVMKEFMKILICTNIDFGSRHPLRQEISR